jgi:hypothetical protein
MAYTPPGVETFVEIGDNQVVLPGGTRILSLIGTANMTKNATAEQQTQPISRSIETAWSGVSSISRIYDYSGPGNSLYVYPASGSGAFGSGYYLTGSNTINWTVAANPYPTSTTPASGATYLANYNFSGSTVSGSTVLESHTFNNTYVGASGTLTAALDIPYGASITAVYSGAGTGSGLFPQSGTSVSGAGWYQSGNNVLFTSGLISDYAAAASIGDIPASGAPFYVGYNYSGTGAVQSLVQTGAYSNTLSQPFSSGVTYFVSLNAVSGTSGYAYPASGTATNPDTSGYSTSGAGYTFNGPSTTTSSVSWSAVNPSSYTYPSATVVPISGVFYLDYSYDKSADDFLPLNFVEYSAVVNQEGNEGDWVLRTSGPLAGTYQNTRVNPLTVGAKVAFANQASVVSLLQISGVANTAGAFLAALPLLEGKVVDVIVPLTVGSGISVNEMPVSEKATALQYTKLHCETMSNEFNKMERVSLGSLGPAEVGDTTTDNTYIKVANDLLSKRIALVAPGTATVQLQDPSGQFQPVDVDGCYLAVAVGALSCSSNLDPATPLTNQQLTGFTRISAKTSGHPNTDYLAVEMNNMAANGVMIIARNGSRIYVRHQLTTKVDNVIDGEFSVVTLIDYVSQSVRYTTNQFIGKKLLPQLIIPSVKGTILATMQQLAANGIIGAIGTINVTINPLNPTELLSQVSYVPVFPLNRLKVTFIIRTSI